MSKESVCLTLIAVLWWCVGPGVLAAQRTVELVPGAEFAAGANLTAKNVKADGTIFIPDDARHVRAVIVLVESWPGPERAAERPFLDLAVGRFRDQVWRRLSQTCECALLHLRLGTVRPLDADASVASNVVRNAAVGGADALLVILQRLGEESAHQELKDTPLLFSGWSAPGSFGTSFAGLYPERTVAFIRYHSHRRGLPADIKVLKNIPALLIAGSKDELAGTEDAETLWKSGRSAGSPWTFAIEPDAPHVSEEIFKASQTLMIPWIEAVLRQRLVPGGTGLRPVTDDSGWLGNNQSAEVASQARFAGPKEEASWLPDEVTARGWRLVLRAAK